LTFYTSPEYLDDVVCPSCSLKLTLEKLRAHIDKGRKKCEIARRVFDGQERERPAANGVSDQPNPEESMLPEASQEFNCLADLMPRLRGHNLPAETSALLALPFASTVDDLAEPAEDTDPALLRLHLELFRLHLLIHDLAALEKVSPDEFLELDKDKLNVEKVGHQRRSFCPPFIAKLLTLSKVRHVPIPPYRTTKRLTISRFPKVLALHVQRSVYLASGRAVKNACRVGGFGELWDASLPGARRPSGIFATVGGPDAARQVYRLQAVVLHYGSHDSGHFVVYRRMPARGFGNVSQWARIEEALEKIFKGQDPHGRLAQSVDEWCTASLGLGKEAVPAVSTNSETAEATAIAPGTQEENGHPMDAKHDDGSGGGDSPTLHGSIDDEITDTALDTDTDTGSNPFQGAEVDLASSQNDVSLLPLAEEHVEAPAATAMPAAAAKPKSTRVVHPPQPDAWYRISDDNVDLVDDPEREVYEMFSGQAYMFYFERLE
jgi:hypothetical protein